MQFGNLTENEILKFEKMQRGSVRNPTFTLWIEGFGEISKYAIEINTDIAVEYELNIMNIGLAVITVNNKEGYFDKGIDRYSRIKIWAGFSSLNIPIFTGFVDSVEPTGTRGTVQILCRDYMGLFEDILIFGNQEPSNTPKLLLEQFCSEVNVQSELDSGSEMAIVYSDPSFERRTLKSAVEEICRSVFHFSYFDERGYLKVKPRGHKKLVSFIFNDNNVRECEAIRPTTIINSLEIEYRENFFATYINQANIDRYGKKSRTDRTLILNSEIASSKYEGSTTEELDHDLEAFKITSQSDSTIVDCIHIKMRQSGCHGYMTCKIYTDSAGIPETLVATSQLKASASLSIFGFSWEILYFIGGIEISPSTDYWIAIDTASVSAGTMYVQISAATMTGKHAYYDSGWNLEDNKQVLHYVSGSRDTRRVAQESLELFGDPHEQVQISAPAIPQLQLLDEVFVDIKTRNIAGRYIINRRKHTLTPEYYSTADYLRRMD